MKSGVKAVPALVQRAQGTVGSVSRLADNIDKKLAVLDALAITATQRTFAVDRPAPTPNAAGGVTALVECTEELERLLEEWVSHSDSRSPSSANRN